MRLLTAVSTVRVCQGQPKKRSTQAGCFSFFVRLAAHALSRTLRASTVTRSRRFLIQRRTIRCSVAALLTSLPGAAKKKEHSIGCVLFFVLPRRTRTVSSAMWACALRAPAELCAEGASPAKGQREIERFARRKRRVCDKGAPYKSDRGSRAGSTKMHPLKDLGFSEVFSISRGGTKFG